MAKYNTNYKTLHSQIQAFFTDEPNVNSNVANFAALIYTSLPDLNWAGFYLWSKKHDALKLNSFQGNPACVTIKKESGVCGHGYTTQKTIMVPNVDDFPGHIVCDSASKSEIVLPLFDKNNKIIGVFDIDSPIQDRFSLEDKEGLETAIILFTSLVDITKVQE